MTGRLRRVHSNRLPHNRRVRREKGQVGRMQKLQRIAAEVTNGEHPADAVPAALDLLDFKVNRSSSTAAPEHERAQV